MQKINKINSKQTIELSKYLELQKQFDELKNKNSDLEKQLEIQKQFDELKNKISDLEKQIEIHKETIQNLTRRLFGRKSERNKYLDEENPQLTIFDFGVFNEVEVSADPEVCQTKEVKSYKRSSPTTKRKYQDIDLSTLPKVTNVIELPESNCPHCSSHLQNIPDKIIRKIKVIPEQFIVEETIIKQACCTFCDSKTISQIVPEVIPNSYASSSLISAIITNKYLLALPLDRQEKYFNSLGLKINKQSMSNWIMYVSQNYLQGLYDLMKEKLLSLNVIHADETPVKVIQGTPSQNYYQWVYLSGKHDVPIILYDCCKGRGSEHPIKFLKGYNKFLSCDGWSAYKNLKDVTLVSCLAHIRRKFTDITNNIVSSNNSKTVSHKIIRICAALFKLDEIVHNFNDSSNRLYLKQTIGKKLLDYFYQQLDNYLPMVAPKSNLGKALGYSYNVKKTLYNYLLSPDTEISNNIAERAIKTFVIGRKNWLFSYTPRGAESSSIIYSIIKTADSNGLNVFKYLTYILDELPRIKTSQLEQLLPWSPDLPEDIKDK